MAGLTAAERKLRKVVVGIQMNCDVACFGKTGSARHAAFQLGKSKDKIIGAVRVLRANGIFPCKFGGSGTKRIRASLICWMGGEMIDATLYHSGLLKIEAFRCKGE